MNGTAASQANGGVVAQPYGANGSTPLAPMNGEASRAAVVPPPPLFATGDSGSADTSDLKAFLGDLKRLEKDLKAQVLDHVEEQVQGLRTEMHKAGWPSPSVETTRTAGGVRLIISAAENPLALEYGTLTVSERPALRRWLETLGGMS